MPKTIQDEHTKQAQKQLQEFMHRINPKPSEEERERLKQEYLERRKSS